MLKIEDIFFWDYKNKTIVVSKINGNTLYLRQTKSPLDVINKQNDFVKYMGTPNEELHEHSSENYKLLNIGINSSSICNMNCKYCFDSRQERKSLNKEVVDKYIKSIVEMYPNAEKVIIDPTGSREPLMNYDLVEDIGFMALNLSDIYQKEFLTMLVTNGTMLDKQKVDDLRNANILFGVSIDGSKSMHDANRKDKSDQGTYDRIISNVKQIKDRELLGAAVTLNNENMDIIKIYKSLIRYFPTISVKPARGKGELFINENNINYVIEKYEKFSKFLLRKTISEDYRYIAAVINGDDYFGKFIYRSLINEKVSTRCDAGLSRFSLDSDGQIYSCSAAIGIKDLCIGNVYEGINEQKQIELFNILHDKTKCGQCEARHYCGGECMVNSFYNSSSISNVDSTMCLLKKTFFKLAQEFKSEIIQFKHIHKKLVLGCIEKSKRFSLDEDLKNTLNNHPEYKFTEIKRIKDNNIKYYEEIKNS